MTIEDRRRQQVQNEATRQQQVEEAKARAAAMTSL
jgi:hypothetical protein